MLDQQQIATTMITEVAVASERLLQEEKHHDDDDRFWSEKNNASVSMHESILNLTTDDEESQDLASSLHHSFLSDIPTTPLNQSLCEEVGEDGSIMVVVTASASTTPAVTPTRVSCCEPEATTHTVLHKKPHNSSFTEWTTKLIDTSSTSLHNVTESFVEGLCPAQVAPPDEQTCGDVMSRVVDSTQQATHKTARKQAELDFLSLLGCVDPPTDDELVQVWPHVQKREQQPVVDPPVYEKRASAEFRAKRIQRLRHEQFYSAKRRSSPRSPRTQTFAEARGLIPVMRTKSMDEDLLRTSSESWSKRRSDAHEGPDSLGDWLLGGGNLFDAEHEDLGQVIGKGLEPIELNAEEDDIFSYDSDPGEDWDHPWSDPGVSSLRETSLLDMEVEEEEEAAEEPPPPPSPIRRHVAYDGHRARIAERAKEEHVMERVDPSIQDTMNCTWTLTLHPRLDHDPHGKPKTVNVWMERGTMLHMGATIVEPKIMWREVYQPNLDSRRLSLSFQQPTSLRLLIICRVLAASSVEERTERYPFLQESRSFCVKTCEGDEYMFEAASPEEARHIGASWKQCVARLASLAVVEDMENMATEFFTPLVQNQMLTTYE